MKKRAQLPASVEPANVQAERELRVVSEYHRRVREVEARMGKCKTPNCGIRGRYCCVCSDALWAVLNPKATVSDRRGGRMFKTTEEIMSAAAESLREMNPEEKAEARRYIEEEFGNDVAARECRFCGRNLANEAAEDIIEYPFSGEAAGPSSDYEEFVCADCYDRKNLCQKIHALDQYGALGARQIDAMKKFEALKTGLAQ